MTHSSWAYTSNYLIYSSMAVYTLAFFAHAYETAWAVRSPESQAPAGG
ncbi:MAG: c-type cytochrome biogenesis protein CcsB, partial [Actinobacteria bacterium]|nr:c-type cytochrome biogenesis protein CcsB [Actinomycetota bacterium]MSZ85733.1 c-type cytochrome biogenesis protein CcsB [Actinomycetota bacterium]